jgi:NADPH2:quinone reductase
MRAAVLQEDGTARVQEHCVPEASGEIQAARLLGAGLVVAASRHRDAQQYLKDLGADAVLTLNGSTDLPAAVRDLAPEGVDVVVDPVWSELAVSALECLAVAGRLVQLGAASGPTATVSASVMRRRLLSVLGYNNLLAPRDVKRAAYLDDDEAPFESDRLAGTGVA